MASPVLPPSNLRLAAARPVSVAEGVPDAVTSGDTISEKTQLNLSPTCWKYIKNGLMAIIVASSSLYFIIVEFSIIT